MSAEYAYTSKIMANMNACSLSSHSVFLVGEREELNTSVRHTTEALVKAYDDIIEANNWLHQFFYGSSLPERLLGK